MTPVILFVLLFLFGTIIGSFLNVVGVRLNSGLSLGGRSHCHVCRKRLEWWELVPIVSFFALRGRCSRCQAPISSQYPLVELWTGLIFATVPLIFVPVFCLYVVIAVYDLRHKVIPDGFVYAAIILATFIHLFFDPHSFLDWMAGPILFAIFAAGWFLSRGRVIGFGDAKLALSIGLLLGAAEGFSAVVLAFWIGAATGILLVIRRKGITIKSELPFAPFLIVGSSLALLFHLDLLHVTFF